MPALAARGFPAMLGPMAPPQNSLRSLRSLRSIRCGESEHEARAARARAMDLALLGCAYALRRSPAHAFAGTTVACGSSNSPSVAARWAVPGGSDFWGAEKRSRAVGTRAVR